MICDYNVSRLSAVFTIWIFFHSIKYLPSYSMSHHNMGRIMDLTYMALQGFMFISVLLRGGDIYKMINIAKCSYFY